jgi:hypothetical protein
MEFLIFINFGQDTNSCRSWAGGTTPISAGQKTIHKGMNTRACGNIQTPSIRYNPLAPKFNVNVIWRALAPMDEKKIKPLTSLLVTRALKHWDLGVRGFNIMRVAGFESVVHLVSRSLLFSHLVIFKLFQTLLWKHHFACWWSYSKLRKTLACRSNSSCLSPVPFFRITNSQLIPKWLSSVSLPDVFTSCDLQTLLWKHHSACCWSYSKLRKTLACRSKCLPSVSRPIFSLR